jgi:hypothetical protein
VVGKRAAVTSNRGADARKNHWLGHEASLLSGYKADFKFGRRPTFRSGL